MKVELLYFDGCPGFHELLPRLRTLVGDRAEIELRPVETVAEAERSRFLGSPTLRVDGRDVDPRGAARTDYGMKCRLYADGDERWRTPPDEWIRRALDDAA